MSMFIDVRVSSVGGGVAKQVTVATATSIHDYRTVPLAAFGAAVQGRHVLVATHGFNVNRTDGIACLANWEGLLHLDPYAVFVGLLWPGDSIWAHGLDYPEEPRVANEAGRLIASFLDANLGPAASVSFVSHSLGARVVLETIACMTRPVRRLTLMAGAIDDNCLNREFKRAAGKVGEVSVLASSEDHVLSMLFPIGNLFAGIIAEGHPWWRAALGHRGPAQPRPANFRAPFQIPDDWEFGHGDYLRVDPAPRPVIPLPADVPASGAARPVGGANGWHEAWAAAFARTRFQ